MIHTYKSTVSDLPVYYVGPLLEEGSLPAIFYFSLSGEESLSLDPFNQPVEYFKQYPLRIFSMTIPGHDGSHPKEKALSYWAENVTHGIDPLTPFIDTVSSIIEELIEANIIDPSKLATAGLSRGAYIATLVAALQPVVKTVLGFAPLTRLETIKEFQDLKTDPITLQLDLRHYIPKLMHVKLRYYIGSRDLRVSTKCTFELITDLANYAYEHRAKEASFDLIIKNSIGFEGHGTSKSTFEEGSRWLTQILLP